MTEDLCTAALAHEIKNPAAVALAHVNLLRLEDEKQNLDHHLNHIEQALYNICNIVRDMLSAKADETHDTYEVNLTRIINDILETYRAAWPEIDFIFEGKNRLPCYGHETSLRMIFSNIIKNSVEAIEASENTNRDFITISAADHGEYVNVQITDTGSVFACEKPHGNGLGLTICNNLAQGIGAKIATELSEDGYTVSVFVRTVRTICPSLA